MNHILRNFSGRFGARLLAPAGRFGSDERGASLIEFAMLVPLMLTLFVGALEISQAVAVDRKVSIAARSVADLTAQVTDVIDADLTNIFKAAEQVAYPFKAEKLKIKISSVKIDADKVAKIVWGEGSGTGVTKRAPGDVVTALVPLGIRIPNTTVIWGEVEYTYSPIISGNDKDWFWKLAGDKSLTDQIFMRPRLSDCVKRPPLITTCA
jgi:Flp pilus assembly protein TadG